MWIIKHAEKFSVVIGAESDSDEFNEGKDDIKRGSELKHISLLNSQGNRWFTPGWKVELFNFPYISIYKTYNINRKMYGKKGMEILQILESYPPIAEYIDGTRETLTKDKIKKYRLDL